jgi:hypothetical protein
MARLKHVRTGAVVTVADDKAARLGSEWQPVPAIDKPAAKQAKGKK